MIIKVPSPVEWLQKKASSGKNEESQWNAIADLQKRIEQLEADNHDYRNELKKYKKAESNIDVRFAIDWEGLKVFSVERVYKRNNNEFEQTIIGYHKDNGVKEWYLQCTREEHNNLVDQFNEYVKNKPKTESGL